MIALRRPMAICLTALAGLVLTGCVTVLPKSKPAQLYRFGVEAKASDTAPDPGVQILALSESPIMFDRAAAGDRILTVTHQQVAYIAAARWVTPAVTLFDTALTQAFDTQAHATRLTTNGATHTGGSLRLEVRRFEAVYDQGPTSGPDVTVEVELSLTLVGTPERHTRVLATVRADDNRVGAIVSAFNQATGQALGRVVTWTDGAASSR